MHNNFQTFQIFTFFHIMVTKQVFVCLLTQRKTETSIFTGFVLGEYKKKIGLLPSTYNEDVIHHYQALSQ